VYSSKEFIDRQSREESVYADNRRPINLHSLDVLLFPKLREALWISTFGLFGANLPFRDRPSLKQRQLTRSVVVNRA
jgi:hypothetical protein